MYGEYKINLPLEPKHSWGSAKGKHAIAWRRYWKNLIQICKSFKKNEIPYEVEYHFGAEAPYALIFAGKAVRQQTIEFAEAA